MLKSLTLMFGASGTDSELKIDPTGITVFVGPNNSGKSLVLREIQGYAASGRSGGLRIVKHLSIDYQDIETVDRLLATRIAKFEGAAARPVSHVRLTRITPSLGNQLELEVDLQHLRERLCEYWKLQQEGTLPEDFEPWAGAFSQYLNLFTIALDGPTRFALTQPRPAGDLIQKPKNHLAALFIDDDARNRVRSIIHDAFERFFVIDPTDSGKLRIRLSDRAPDSSDEEQSYNVRARAFHAAATDIADTSDGVKAFAGLVSALICSDFRVIIVDEPEAFLHPPLARKLGSTMAKLAGERNANVLASTHSSHFLMGCIESGTHMNVIRLTYERGRPTARHLTDSKLSVLMRDPLLRSTGVLSALFHACAVVCEADRDRAFYEEVNLRLSAAGEPSVQDGVFLNAQNKQTIRRIVRPLREMGVPAAAVVDIDIIRNSDLTHLLNDCGVPSQIVHSLGVMKGDIGRNLGMSWDELKRRGISQTQGALRESFEYLLSTLRLYGIFVVPIGEIEHWLSSLGVTVAKDRWLTAIFEKMGNNPTLPDYVRPTIGDVWTFVGEISAWTSNPSRLGMSGYETGRDSPAIE